MSVSFFAAAVFCADGARSPASVSRKIAGTLHFRLRSLLDKVVEFSFGCLSTLVTSVRKNDSLRNII